MASILDPTHGGGHVQDEFDARDHYYVPDLNTRPPASINLREDHKQLVSDIYAQGRSNSCVANAAAAAFWYEERSGRRDEIWGSAGPSRLFIYWLARGGYLNANHDIDLPLDVGSSTREALKGLAKSGVCDEALWPFDLAKVTVKPPNTAFEAASPRTITAFYRLDPDRPAEIDAKLTKEQKDKIGLTVLDNLRKCLAEQFPVMLSFWYYLPFKDRFDTAGAQYILKEPWTLPGKKFPPHTFPDQLPDALRLTDSVGNFIQPGHTVLAIGYDDARGQVLIQNSWGPQWSGNGTFWIPYSYITDFAASNDFWTIRCSQPDATAEKKRWEDFYDGIMS